MYAEKQQGKIPTPKEIEAMMVVPSWLTSYGVVLLQFIIYGLPLSSCALPFFFIQSIAIKILLLVISPIEYAFLFGFTAGLLSRPFQAGIIKGVFPRDVRFPVYAMRKCYGICWTSVYYFKPVYSIILSIPFLKAITFRLFGYKGSLNFIIYPDSWIRDLSILKIEKGVYISNRATIGTNMCLKEGDIIVLPVKLGYGSMIGHLAMIGPGVNIEDNVEISVGCSIGIKTNIGKNSKVGPCCAIHHRVRIGENVEVGAHVYIGNRVVIKDNLIIPNGTIIPNGETLNSQEDVRKYISSETNFPISI